MQKKQNKAFTLVELIVVITILAILGTIAFLSLQGYSKQARDSRRISDISNIKTSLELFSINTGFYPEPDNGLDVDYNTELVYTQGTIGDTVTTNLSRNLHKKPLDPLFDLEYIYSRAASKKEYEVMSIHEGDLSSNNLISSSYAANNYNVKIGGNYNEVFVKTTSYIVPIPSIITSETLPLDLFSTPTAISSMIVTNGTNFPNLNIANTTRTTGELAMNLSVTGVIDDNSSDAEKISVINFIQLAYSGSDLESGSIYKNILSKTDDNDKLKLVEYIILDKSVKKASNEQVTSIYTFTNCGETGRIGPTLTTCRSSYETSWDEDDLYFNMTTQGIQEWTIPETGMYTIATYGAKGGGDNGGLGTIMQGDFNLQSGDVLKILVGQQGSFLFTPNNLQSVASGGGGTFVTMSNNTPLIISGGGGGSGLGGLNSNATITTSGKDGNIGGLGGLGGIGGVDGSGGNTPHSFVGGGGGLNGDGVSSYGGKSFINGGNGGDGGVGNYGGFGGGGSSYRLNNWAFGSGGGGYSGGGAAHYNTLGWYIDSNGGGGGSYNSGTNQVNTEGSNSGDGKVIITLIN